MDLSALERLPVGLADFEALREDGCVYVDKTELISAIACRPRRLLLTRPRRFGKSLLASTLRSLFCHGREHFAGLKLASLWQDQTYPVIYLNFAMYQRGTCEEFQAAFLAGLQILGRSFGIDALDGITDSAALLSRIVGELSQRGRSPVLIVDEYDAPLTGLLQDPVQYAKVRACLSRFYAEVNKFAWRLVFITGVVSWRGGILAALEGLEDLSKDADCAALLGFTAHEVREYFPGQLTAAAQLLNLSADSLTYLLELYYGGWCFDGTGKTSLINPWALLNFFDYGCADFDPYWSLSGGSSPFMVQLLQSYARTSSGRLTWAQFARSERQGLWCGREELRLNDDPQALSPETILYQAGYLTVKAAKDSSVRLGLPNLEVRRAFMELFFTQIDLMTAEDETRQRNLRRELLAALASGEGEIMRETLAQVLQVVGEEILGYSAIECRSLDELGAMMADSLIWLGFAVKQAPLSCSAAGAAEGRRLTLFGAGAFYVLDLRSAESTAPAVQLPPSIMARSEEHHAAAAFLPPNAPHNVLTVSLDGFKIVRAQVI